MKRNNLARCIFLVLILLWAGTEMWPPWDRPEALIDEFRNARDQDNALFSEKDETFSKVIAAATANYKKDPSNEFGDLYDAVEENGLTLTNYFPKMNFRKGQVPDNRLVLQTLQKKVAGKIQLGLDLKGGSSFLVAMDTNKLDSAAASGALAQAVEVLRSRVDSIGVAEPDIRTMGDNKIMIQLPGLSEADQADAKNLVTKAAFLEFALVHKNSSTWVANRVDPIGYEKYEITTKDDEGNSSPSEVLVEIVDGRPGNKYGLKGKDIIRAYASRSPLNNLPMINFGFNSDGGAAMAQLSGENVGRQMAIILDDKLLSAPTLQERITNNGQITGDFTPDEAATIANALLNPLSAPLIIEEEMSVEPKLGQDSIDSGKRAAIFGIFAVAIFMLAYYWIAGLVANFALALNLFILIGVMCYLDAALTLPGIAGIVLTIGMAIDANVLIFERIREELKAGKSKKGAVETGYSKAFGTIIDANLTTLIVSVILMSMGTGPVKGFGVTLTVGICASMFTALVVTRLVFDLFKNYGTGQGFRLMDQPKFNFMGLAKYAFAVSWLLVAFGIGKGILIDGNKALGVDFRGGDQLTFEFPENDKKDLKQLRDVVEAVAATYYEEGDELPEGKKLGDIKTEAVGIGNAMIQYQAGAGSRERLQVTVPFGSGEAAESALAKDVNTYYKEGDELPEGKSVGDIKTEGLTKVSQLRTGPSISKEILQSATKSLLIALFAILVYVTFRYEFSFALGAILAIIHDVLMTLGIFFFFDGQLSAPVMAAILTVIGFSINDTIVIFDRIREDLKLNLPGSFTEIMNGAISKTLSRTVITSGTTLMAAGSLFLLGGGAIHSFAFVLLAGVVTGTFSSIFIAGYAVLWKNNWKKPSLADETLITQNSISISEA